MTPGQVIKTFMSKEARAVVLRYPKKEDLDKLLNFANKIVAEDTFVQLSGKPKTKKEEKEFLEDALQKIEKGDASFLLAFIDSKVAGVGSVVRQKNRQMHAGLMGISLAPDFRGEGIGSELFNSLIEEGKKMGLKLLYLHCFEGNEVAMKMYEKFGFKKAGFLPGIDFYKGKYIGEVIMYLTI